MSLTRRVLMILSVLTLFLAAKVVSSADKRHPAEEAGLKSVDSRVETTITFVNKTQTTIKVYWLDFEGNRVLYGTLEAGDTHEQPTFLTHPWVITDENGDAWYLYFPDGQPRTVEVVAPPKGKD